jgi:hypothetical protein
MKAKKETGKIKHKRLHVEDYNKLVDEILVVSSANNLVQLRNALLRYRDSRPRIKHLLPQTVVRGLSKSQRSVLRVLLRWTMGNLWCDAQGREVSGRRMDRNLFFSGYKDCLTALTQSCRLSLQKGYDLQTALEAFQQDWPSEYNMILREASSWFVMVMFFQYKLRMNFFQWDGIQPSRQNQINPNNQ